MSCEREHEVFDALSRGFVGRELDEHVASCASCSELRIVAGALLDDRESAVEEAEVPAAGAMLWRIRVRNRREIEARARRILMIGQAATLAVAITLVAYFFGKDLGTPLIIGAAASFLLAPVAGWVAIRRG